MSFFSEELNPFIKIFKNLDPVVQEDYKQKGKHLYEYIDFETCNLYETNPTYLDIEAVQRCLQSGMKMEDLTEQEREILNKIA